MIEQGLVKLVQADATVQSLVNFRGGRGTALPKDAELPSWCYTVIAHDPQVTLDEVPLQSMMVQIEAYGKELADAIPVAHAIERLLNNFRGTLEDEDSTYVSITTQVGKVDFQNPESRNHCRAVTYTFHFSAQES
jgi:hypothetical protein